MADFETAYNRVKQNEGGYSDKEEDNGNWTGGMRGVGILVGTNYGITAPEYAAYIGKVPTVSDMKSMSPETAKFIFKKKYWMGIRGDEIVNQDTANGLIDMAVNAGIGTAIILEKRAARWLPENTVMDDNFLNKINQTV